MISKKFNINRIIEICCVVFFIIVFIILNKCIDNNRRRTFDFSRDNNKYAYEVENISVEDNVLKIQGWFFELESIRNVSIDVNKQNELGVLLYDLNSQNEKNEDGILMPHKGIECRVERNTRKDINDYFCCDYDYSNCGFIAEIDLDSIDLDRGEYQIVFKTDINSSVGGINSSAYINKGKLIHVSPKDDCLLHVQGTDLEDVINKGYCLMSNHENNVFIYQYKNLLYWIVNQDFWFEENGSTYIQYQLDTTQFDKLPEDRLKNGWYWDNLGANFEDYEITDKMDCGNYRVSVRELPLNYAVYWIYTGHCTENQWIWESSFRPIISSLLGIE